MIVMPTRWEKDYEVLAQKISVDLDLIIDKIAEILRKIDVPHLAYSGGVDSSIMLAIMSAVYTKQIHTYTISSRQDHPDVKFARMGSKRFETKHHEFIVTPTTRKTDRFPGDNAVRQFFEKVRKHTDEIICCDGIDEFMCGYYDHLNGSQDTYRAYLSRLTPDHLIPLDSNSGNTKVFLPYLSDSLIGIYRMIPLHAKTSATNTKIIMKAIAMKVYVTKEIIERNKYGFCDAFVEKDK